MSRVLTLLGKSAKSASTAANMDTPARACKKPKEKKKKKQQDLATNKKKEKRRSRRVVDKPSEDKNSEDTDGSLKDSISRLKESICRNS